MHSRAALLLLSLCPVFGWAADEAEPTSALKLSGYYKNLLTASETVFPAGQRYTVDLNRLRLKIEGHPSDALSVDLQYDNEVLVGNYLDTAQFKLQKGLPEDTYWRARQTYADEHGYYGRHRLYRAALTWTSGSTDIRLGRQRIAWGTGRFFSPLDILNPFSPVALERGERVGVDAVLVERKLDALSRVSAVYAPQRDTTQSSAAAQWHSNYRGFDYSLVAGRFKQQNVLGADLAGQIGQAGVRAEMTRTRGAGGSTFTRVLIGVDYAFANTLTVTGELYRDGSGASDPARYDFASLFAGRIQNVGRRYAAAHASYEITPLVKAVFDAVSNLGDRSHYLSPSLTWSIRSSLDLTVGVQLFKGRTGSEYGALKNMAYTQLQWFF